jgi:acyl-coenzyme A synthetase/AMP-(fatty) acid ligase
LGDEWPGKHSMKSLRLLGTVGEPINPEAWMWYREHIGHNRCPIVDTWWQTETGMIMIAPLPGRRPPSRARRRAFARRGCRSGHARRRTRAARRRAASW